MRHIKKPEKSESPAALERWKRRHPNANYQRLRENRIKSAVKDALVRRQEYVCCYCECRITDDVSHIEHISPQHGGVAPDTLDFSNMAASCIKEPTKPAEFAAIKTAKELFDSVLHCGHARGAHPVVSPYDPKCESLFFHSLSGQILPAEGLEPSDMRLAKESIEYLRLNAPTLVILRQMAIFETVKLLKAGVEPRKIFLAYGGRLIPFISSAHAAARFLNMDSSSGERTDGQPYKNLDNPASNASLVKTKI